MTNAAYSDLVRQADELNLTAPPAALGKSGNVKNAWRSGYLSALRDLAEGRIYLHTTPPAEQEAA